MNPSEIETLLRHAPAPAPPPGLLEKLEASVRLPKRAAAEEPRGAAWGPFKRWLPALAYAVLIFGCLIGLAVQTSELLDLRHENEELRQTAQDLGDLREANLALQQTATGDGKEAAELAALQVEVARLREEAARAGQLRADNERLQAELAASTGAAEDPFAAENNRALSIKCVNNLKQIGLAMRLYSSDNEDQLPPDFLNARDYVSTPLILSCPADKDRTPAASWERFDGSNVSYEFLLPGIKQTNDPSLIMVRCPIHGHVGLLDGSVQMGGPSLKVVTENGRLKMAPSQP